MNTNKILLGSRKKAFPRDLMYLQSDINYSKIYFSDGKIFLSSTTLKILENRLQDYCFYRINRSCLINLNYVKNYQNLEDRGIIILQNNEQILVSRRRNKALKNLLIA